MAKKAETNKKDTKKKTSTPKKTVKKTDTTKKKDTKKTSTNKKAVTKKEVKKTVKPSKSANASNSDAKTNNIISIVFVCILIIGAFVALIVYGIRAAEDREEAEALKEQERYNALPVKVNISMTNWKGNVEEIIDYFDLDFSEVTSGATCNSDVKTTTYDTKKYGKLYVEFSYCKSSYIKTIKVYNLESDQELRDAKDGEVATFDEYGEIITETTEVSES